MTFSRIPLGSHKWLGASFVIVFLVLIQNSRPTAAYAAWLKCYVDLDETEVIMNFPVALPEDSPHQVFIEVRFDDEEEWITSDNPMEARKNTVQARLRVPEALRRREVQYVIETTEGGHFVPPTVCEGRRTHAFNYDEPVVLELDPSSSSSSVQVWAGWATGHEPVSLTPRLTLLPKRSHSKEEEL